MRLAIHAAATAAALAVLAVGQPTLSPLQAALGALEHRGGYRLDEVLQASPNDMRAILVDREGRSAMAHVKCLAPILHTAPVCLSDVVGL